MTQLLGRLSVATKIALAPLFLLVSLAVVAAVVLSSMAQTREAIVRLEQVRFPAYEAAQRLAFELERLSSMVNQSLAWAGAEFKEETIAKLDASIAAEFQKIRGVIGAQAKNADLDDAGRAEFKALLPLFAKYEKAAMDTLDMKSAGLSTAAILMTTADGDYANLNKMLQQIVVGKRSATSQDFAHSQAIAATATKVLLIALALALLLSVPATWFVVRAINEPLRQAVQVANAVSEGDLTARADSRSSDATGRMLGALSTVATNLSTIVEGIRDSARSIDTASLEIAQGNSDLSSRTEQQACTLQQTAASVEQLTSTVRRNADSARHAKQLAEGATQVAYEGNTAVADVVATMGSIDQQAKRIAEIIGTIDGIAFQTNILALNAAVEAARAGEQGRGFAVVASEVRTLAGRSADAAKQIRALIQTSVDQVQAGTAKAGAAGETMQRVVETIRRVEQMVAEIATASTEQATGIEQVNDAVASMDRATQQNAALVEEASAAADSLRTQAGKLVESMAAFRTQAA
ncbi:MAG: hypothetical protein ABS84_17785 [Rubrivivax sp. SCN 71-131]|jgi:methyl-accepting chemotaxis protein|nr:MAG: hypothetical protein ABS84_17785 [Rubrivivax sp. SCN 71-131]